MGGGSACAWPQGDIVKQSTAVPVTSIALERQSRFGFKKPSDFGFFARAWLDGIDAGFVAKEFPQLKENAEAINKLIGEKCGEEAISGK